MNQHTEEIMNRLSNEWSRRNIEFLASSEGGIFHLLHYPKRENPAVSVTIVNVDEDFIELSSFLETGDPKNLGLDYAKYVDELVALYLEAGIMTFYLGDPGSLVLSQIVLYEDKDIFTDTDVEHVFETLKHLDDTTTKLEEKIQAVFR